MEDDTKTGLVAAKRVYEPPQVKSERVFELRSLVTCAKQPPPDGGFECQAGGTTDS